MADARGLRGQGGFIALYAVLTLLVLVGVVALVLAHSSGIMGIQRAEGGKAQADRLAYGFISRQLTVERLQVPHAWTPALQGSWTDESGATLAWTRRPVESRWRAGARPWTPEFQDRLLRLGADPSAVRRWSDWLQDRQLRRDPALGFRGDLVGDPEFLRRIFRDLGLEDRWRSADRIWTLDEGGAMGPLNLLGADPEVVGTLTGLDPARIRQIQARASQGLPDAGAAQSLLDFSESQALAPVASLRAFSEAEWVVEVHLPSLKEPIFTRWRSSLDEGTPGNPWFAIREWGGAAW